LPAFRDRVLALTAAFELNVSKELLDAADAAAVECMDYFDALIAKKRASPAHDLLSQLVHGEETLTVEEINTLAMLVLFAGFETTTNLIGNGVLALLDHPDQLDLLRSQPELYANLPAELLRHGGTAQLVNRVTTEDVAIGEMVIPAGEAVFPLIGAANRDPDRYPDPDRLDVTRVDIRPLSFGGGVHHCLGAALAEMEIEIVFRKLIERFDLTDLASVRLPHRDRLVLRGPATVPIRLGRRLSNAGGSTGLSARPSTGDAQWRAEYRTRFEQTASGANREQITELVHVLERIPVFAAFGTAELALLATTAYPIAFDPEDRLCEQGSTAADCYVVIEGEAEISIDGSLVGSVGADEVVGERGPILDQARAATVTATSHVITFAISRDRLHEVMASNPDAAREMTKILAARYDG
jgi:hypothetical protein